MHTLEKKMCAQLKRQQRHIQKYSKAKRKSPDDTHTLRHVLGSNPGGRFPLRIGSIFKIKVQMNK